MQKLRVISILALGLSSLGVTVALAAVTIHAPKSARIGGAAIHVSARGLRRATGYSLTLAADPSPTRLTVCVARLATHKKRATTVSFTVSIPRRLHCYENDSVSLGSTPTKPGTYHLVVAVPDGPSGFAGTGSFSRVAIKLTR